MVESGAVKTKFRRFAWNLRRGKAPKMGVDKVLSKKCFHEVLSGHWHTHLLKSRYGKDHLVCGSVRHARENTKTRHGAHPGSWTQNKRGPGFRLEQRPGL